MSLHSRYKYRIGDTIKRVIRPVMTREQMNYEFELLKARLPKTKKQLRLDAKQFRVLECD